MRQPRAVLDGYALEHLALPEDEWQRAEKTAHRLIEATCRLAQQHKPEDALVQEVARNGECGDRCQIHAYPCGDYSEQTVRPGPLLSPSAWNKYRRVYHKQV